MRLLARGAPPTPPLAVASCRLPRRAEIRWGEGIKSRGAWWDLISLNWANKNGPIEGTWVSLSLEPFTVGFFKSTIVGYSPLPRLSDSGVLL